MARSNRLSESRWQLGAQAQQMLTCHPLHRGALRSAAWLGQVPWLYWAHDALMPYIGNHLGINARHGGLRQFAAREINARKDRGSDRNDILAQVSPSAMYDPLHG